MDADRQSLRAIAGSKTTLTLALFLAGVASLAWVPSPAWDGAVVDVAPDLSRLGGDGTPFLRIDPDREQDVEVVALPAATVAPSPHSSGPDPGLVATLGAMEELATTLGDPVVPIEVPCLEERQGRCVRGALDRLFGALLATAEGRADKPVRWTQLGDSMTAWVHLPAHLRKLLQSQFGDGGYGLVHPGRPGHALDPIDLERTSSGWRVKTIPFHQDPGFGIAGVSFRDAGRARTTLTLPTVGRGSATREIGALLWTSGVEARFTVEVDGERHEVVEPGSGSHLVRLAVDRPPEEIAFSGFDPDEVVQGFVLEHPGPGVIVENLGIVSAREDHLPVIDTRVFRDQLALLDSDVLVYLYGAVSANDEAWHRKTPSSAWVASYRRTYGQALAMRPTRGSADCLVVSVLTRAYPAGGRMAVFPSVPVTERAQHDEALARGCAFWSAHRAMGGMEGADAWYWHEPRLLDLDLRHPTRAGFRKLGTLLYTSLVHAFRDWLRDRVDEAGG